MLTRTLWIGVAANHAIDSLRDLDLQPFRCAAFLVAAAAFLREDAFQALLFRDLEQCDPLLSRVMIGVADYFAGYQNFLEHTLALFECDAPEIVSVEEEQIEDVIKDGQVVPRRALTAMTANARALLHQAERRTTLLVEHNHFAVENSILCFDKLWQLAQLGISRRKVVLISGNQAHSAVLNERNGAVSVPLDLEQPVGVLERLLYYRS